MCKCVAFILLLKKMNFYAHRYDVKYLKVSEGGKE